MAEIYFISISDNGKYFIAAEHKHVLHIFETKNLTCINIINTIFDSCDDQVITNDGEICIVSAYHVNGVAAYYCKTGEVLWQRKDLKKARRMSFNIDNTVLFISFDDKPMQVIDVRTGETIEKLRGVRCKVVSHYNDVYMIERINFQIYKNDNKRIGYIRMESFGALDIIWGENILFISEVGRSIRAISLDSTKELWRYTPDAGSHFLELGYNLDLNYLYGICFQYKEIGTKILYCFDSATGDIISSIEIKELGFDSKLSKEGNKLITSSGYIYDLNGVEIIENVRKIEF